MFSTRLKALRKQRALTQIDLAKHFNVSQQAIAKWESSQSFPESRTVAGLAEFFDVSADYLLGIADSVYPASAFSSVKIIGTVKAGYDALAYEEDLGTSAAEVEDADAHRYLIVKGDSMEPYIRHGDLALVKLQEDLKNGDLGVVIYGDGDATLKEYSYKNGVVSLVPFNDEYETITISGDDLERFRVFGKVIETRSKW
ncbi:MAG: LexA family transcriptional regulator [Defluviitaleaceae bacterium]|nr:LexA family transcriptional regulator [Defluviitaleaceae bacterium]